MDNPFVLLRMIWRAKRPSCTADMHAVRNTFWLHRGYAALTFFGTIITSTSEEAQLMNGRFSVLKNHEMIHLKQAQATGDSWIRFYCLYIWYWLRALPQNRYMRNAAYLLNPFELEAYKHMYDLDYLTKCADGANGWREYSKLSPHQRLLLYLSQKDATD